MLSGERSGEESNPDTRFDLTSNSRYGLPIRHGAPLKKTSFAMTDVKSDA